MIPDCIGDAFWCELVRGRTTDGEGGGRGPRDRGGVACVGEDVLGLLGTRCDLRGVLRLGGRELLCRSTVSMTTMTSRELLLARRRVSFLSSGEQEIERVAYLYQP
jgi:hypothetical protein